MSWSRLPWLLVAGRCALALGFLPALVLDYPAGLSSGILLLGLLTDYCDGVLARRWGVSTLALRRADSRVDIVFYGCALLPAAHRDPALLSSAPWLLIGFASLFLVRNAVDFFRYRASPSYHMLSGRIWAGLFVLFLLVAYRAGDSLPWAVLAFCVYAVNAVEGIIASLILPVPTKDIPTLWHAWRLRRAGRVALGLRS